ncbi:hypothetical protein ACLKA7_012877 [Drosophila subpalustris]
MNDDRHPQPKDCAQIIVGFDEVASGIWSVGRTSAAPLDLTAFLANYTKLANYRKLARVQRNPFINH